MREGAYTAVHGTAGFGYFSFSKQDVYAAFNATRASSALIGIQILPPLIHDDSAADVTCILMPLFFDDARSRRVPRFQSCKHAVFTELIKSLTPEPDAQC